MGDGEPLDAQGSSEQFAGYFNNAFPFPLGVLGHGRHGRRILRVSTHGQRNVHSNDLGFHSVEKNQSWKKPTGGVCPLSQLLGGRGGEGTGAYSVQHFLG